MKQAWYWKTKNKELMPCQVYKIHLHNQCMNWKTGEREKKRWDTKNWFEWREATNIWFFQLKLDASNPLSSSVVHFLSSLSSLFNTFRDNHTLTTISLPLYFFLFSLQFNPNERGNLSLIWLFGYTSSIVAAVDDYSLFSITRSNVTDIHLVGCDSYATFLYKWPHE